MARPIVVVTHGAGIDVLLAAAELLGASSVVGAYIVAPTAPEGGFPGQALPFNSVLIAPDNHPELTSEAAASLALALGGHFVDAGSVGRLDAQSGHGPWPEGLMRLGWFLKQLGTTA